MIKNTNQGNTRADRSGRRWHVEGGSGGRAAHDGVVARDGGEGKQRGRAACEGAVVVARDRASDPSMWVGMRGSGLGARGRGRRQGEGRAWVVGGRCILMGLCRHVRGVIGVGASGKERVWAASKRTVGEWRG